MIFKWPCRRAKKFYQEELARMDVINIESIRQANRDLVRREVKALERVAELEEKLRRQDRTFARLVRLYYKNKEKHDDAV